MMCGVAGALYVPQVGIINPGEMSAASSIEIAIWAAVGGAARWSAPSSARLSSTAPRAGSPWWRRNTGCTAGRLFIVVTLFLPDGIAGLVRKLRRRKPVDSSKSSKEGAAHDARSDGRRHAPHAGGGGQGAAQDTESGGRKAGLAHRHAGRGGCDPRPHLYLEDVHVSFDGFKAINGLNLDIARASCAASSAPMAPARPR
jgi:hypothetical protein